MLQGLGCTFLTLKLSMAARFDSNPGRLGHEPTVQPYLDHDLSFGRSMLCMTIYIDFVTTILLSSWQGLILGDRQALRGQLLGQPGNRLQIRPHYQPHPEHQQTLVALSYRKNSNEASSDVNKLQDGFSMIKSHILKAKIFFIHFNTQQAIIWDQ